MTSQPFLSSSWYRIADLRPRLPEHAELTRQRYRGHVWYVLQDQVSGRAHRLSPASYAVLAGMDGVRTVDDLWIDAGQNLAEEAPSQDDFARLLSQLYAADLLLIDTPPDALELFDRTRKHERSSIWRILLNPLALRIPVWNPDPFLTRTHRLVGWIFGWTGLLLWLAVVGPSIFLAAPHWHQLTENASDQILSAHNLILIALLYPIIKGLHELAHGYAVKCFGGRVPEMGIMLLVLLPIPYVDASAAWGFSSKWKRMVVGAAGMLVEVFLAALALYVWLLVEPGMIRALAFNTILIAGISTLLFNGNPLLRYDGYYLLSDLLEIPNLAQRATRYWGYLVERHVFRTDDTEPPTATPGERIWFILYAPTSFIYRQVVMIAIAIFIASEYLAIGVALAIWSIVTGLLLPIGKALWHVVASPRLERNRVRAVGTTGFAIAAGSILLFLVPAPLHTNSEGVVWLPESAIVRAGTDGFVRRVLLEPGQFVIAGEPMVESEEPVLAAKFRTLRARVEELEAQLMAERFTDRAQAEVTSTELKHARVELAHEGERLRRLVSHSPAEGVFALARAEDLPGRFVREGQVLGYVLPMGSRIIRATISQDDVDLVRNRLRSTEIKLSERLQETIPVRLIREVPAGRDELPSKALTGSGGGIHAVDPRDPHGLKTLQRTFQVDLALPEDRPPAGAFGSRVLVRFDHHWEPLGQQLWRRVRQLLLSRLHA